MSTILLIGAGASFGSGSVDPVVPPLGNNLYKELCEFEFSRYWYNFNLGNYGFNDPHVGFEKAYEKILSTPDSYITALWTMREMAMFFSRFKCNILSENNYFKLFDGLRKYNLLDNMLITSLNYECILEDVISKMNIDYYYEFGDLEPEHQTGMPIYKLHGSCNFRFNRKNIDLEGVSGCSNLNIDAPLEAMDLKEAFQYYSYNTHNDFFPIMSFYAKGKNARTGSNSIYRLGETWKKKVKNASNIHIIGARYTPDDIHIWGPINKSKAKIVYWGGESDLKLIPTWLLKSKRFEFKNEYFDRSCISIPKMLANL